MYYICWENITFFRFITVGGSMKPVLIATAFLPYVNPILGSNEDENCVIVFVVM